ncbi:Molybdopterin biosynthesis MoaE [Kalaharituber pfeilii]|nr:Molybdopterin biosynthesis MoaE [Kalaharituber pfeilii]
MSTDITTTSEGSFIILGTRSAFGKSKPVITVGLTTSPLSVTSVLDEVKDPRAGAVVFFAGTTRDNFDNRPVSHLTYSAYPPLTLRTMSTIASTILEKHGLISVYIIHRLGEVPIGEESILVAVAAPHRKAAWRAGEECLEIVKEKVEIWKKEEFADGDGVWRENREGKGVVKVKVNEEEIVGGDIPKS